MAPRIQRGSRTYKVFYEGRDEIITDNEYQERLKRINIDEEIKNIFKDSEFSIKKIDSSDSSSRNVYKLFLKDSNKHIYIDVYLVKNSGQETPRKRIQIYRDYFGLIKNNNFRQENESFFFMGIYPVDNNECVYVFLDNDGYSLNPQDSYSSLWIDYEAIKATAINGYFFGINKDNANKYFSFKNDFKFMLLESLKNDDYSSIIKNSKDIHYIDNSGKESEEKEIYVEDYIPSRDAVVTIDGKPKIKKNSALREIVFTTAKYTCALCGKEHTFTTNNGKMYFEAHHLIPCNINVQKRFTKKLDHTINLYCLCPECHRKIHLINNSELGDVINTLFSEREKELENVYNLDLDKLINIYQGIDRKDEENM